jgi:hypothetical protein
VRKLLRKRVLIPLASVTAALAIAGGALAFFTSTGSGTGTGSVGTATSWLVSGGSVKGTLYPDSSYSGPDQGVVTGASVTNQATSGYQNLGEIDATISGVTPLTGHDKTDNGEPDCTTSDFQFNSPSSSWTGSGTQSATIKPGKDLAPGGVYNISDLNVAMVDNGADQNNCQNATVTVTFQAK